jgi:hypothetical protein
MSCVIFGALARADRETLEKWLPFFEAFEAGAFALCITADEICVAQIPRRVSVDSDRRLHADDGPAFQWLEGIEDFYWHGVHVPAHVVNEASKISIPEIEKEKNAEVRRVMVERFGPQRFFAEAKFKEVHSDDWGTLMRKELPGDEPILVVKLINSTEEQDGSFKNYFLRVDPQLRPLPGPGLSDEDRRSWFRRQSPQPLTARNAVASTYGVRGESYDLAVQT